MESLSGGFGARFDLGLPSYRGMGRMGRIGSTTSVRDFEDEGQRADGFDLAVVGLGYVGMPQVIEANRVGLRVLGFDIDLVKVENLIDGNSHIDDVSDADVVQALERGFLPTTNAKFLAVSDAILICTPTPLRDGEPDVSMVIEAGEIISEYLKPGHLVVLESTSYPGTTEDILKPVLETGSGLKAGVDFYLASAPERIDPGGPWVLRDIPKLVGGIDEASTNRAEALFSKFCSRVVRVEGTREAEMAKMIENTYRAVNIALVNELMMVSKALGVNIREALRAAGTKPFGFQEFSPGPGVGGHCIPVDPHFLTHRARQLGARAPLAELALEINRMMPHYVVLRARDLLASRGQDLDGAKILLLGVTYKPNVADVRHSPALDVSRELLSLGAEVTYHDPLVADFAMDGIPLRRADDPIVSAQESSLVIMITPHNDYDLQSIAEIQTPILDTRGVFATDAATHL